MVDISHKKACKRTAVAQTLMELDEKIRTCIDGDDIQTPKGLVFATAIIAGIQAGKHTAFLIPLCHNIPISHCNIDIQSTVQGVSILCTVTSAYATGVEIEAITGASIAAITIYDMCKSIHHNMRILETKLLSKEKSHDYNR